MEIKHFDTIAAIATPPGNGGVGIIRVSGSSAKAILANIIAREIKPRFAHFAHFLDEDLSIIDSGIVIYFPAPASYTGEDIVELQAHGGSVILKMLLKRVLSLGARMARPGEFTERAFLNNKLDLAQAEAVADLIESSTEQSARSAQRSMQGEFSDQINDLITELTELRIYIEAAIDFADEEIEFLNDGIVENRLNKLIQQIAKLLKSAQQGRMLRDGMTVVIAGKPNAGKSSLLNALAGHEAAIVTDIAGTTRDILREHIQLDGMPLHIIDTAGLRESTNSVEREGIRRAQNEFKKADKILLLIDSQDNETQALWDSIPTDQNVTVVYNKIDLINKKSELRQTDQGTEIYLSVKTRDGMDLLTEHLKQSVGYHDSNEQLFTARTRHIEALDNCKKLIDSAFQQLKTYQASELIAEDLRIAQQTLSDITGEFSSDDLLGKIFASFCIGK